MDDKLIGGQRRPGFKDPSGPVDEGRRIAGLIPNGRLAVMDNCGHWPQYEDAETFNRIHLDFLLEGADRA